MNDSSSKNVFLDEELQIPVVRYSGFLSLEEFQTIALGGNELRERKSLDIQLALVQDVKVLSKEIQDWIQAEWFPKAISGGLKYLGFVVPASVVAKMSMKSVNKEAEADMPIDIRYFATEEEARTWATSLIKVESI